MEFEYGGRQYMVDKMDCFVQLALVSKLQVIVPSIAKVFMDDKRIMDALRAAISGDEESAKKISEAMTPAIALDLLTSNWVQIAEVVAAIPPDDIKMITQSCMKSLKVRPQNPANGQNLVGWVPVWNSGANAFAFFELEEDLMGLLFLSFQVLKAKLGNFIPALQRTMLGGESQ